MVLGKLRRKIAVVLCILVLSRSAGTAASVEIVVQHGHHLEIGAAAYSPDGSVVASGGESEAIRIWDRYSGDLVRTLPGHAERVVGLAFSPNGKWLASCSTDGTVKLWDYREGRLVHLLTNHVGNWVRRVAFSPDSQRLAPAAYNGKVSVWDVASGQVLQSIQPEGRVVDIKFTPDGRSLVTAYREVNKPLLHLWDLSTEKPTLTLHHSNSVNSIAISKNGRLLASAGEGGRICLWELQTGRLLNAFYNRDKDQISSLDFNPSGTLLAASGSWVGTVWDTASTQLKLELRGHEDGITSISFSPDGGEVMTGCADANVRMWRARDGEWLRTFSRRPPKVPVSSLAFSLDGAYEAIGRVDGVTKVWDARQGGFLYDLKGHEGAVQSLAFSLNGSWLFSGSADRTMRVWDMNHGTVSAFHPYFDRLDTIGVVAVGGREGLIASASGPFASSSLDDSIRLWLSHYDRPTRILRGHRGTVRSVSYALDSDRLVSASSDGTIKLWNSKEGTCLRTVTNAVLAERVVFLDSGRALAVGMADGTLRILDADTLNPIREWKAHAKPVQSLVVSADGRWMATASADQTVAVWNWRSAQELRRFNRVRSQYLPLAFHPQRPVLVFAQEDDRVVHVDVDTGEVLFQRVLFPDGEWLAWNPSRAVYMSSTHGDEHARVRFANQLTPAYPLSFYERELRRQTDWAEALRGPVPVIEPRDWQLWWHRYPYKRAWSYLFGSLAAIWIAFRLWRGWSDERRRKAQEEISRQLIASQERERKRIAAELHDGLGQNLLIIKNRLYLAQQQHLEQGEKLHGQLDDISITVSQTIEEVREISHNLRPYQLDRLGLTKAVQSMVNKVVESGSVMVDSSLTNIDGLFPPDAEIHFYRIVQESLNNIVKHSDAATARLSIEIQHRTLRMQIEDDGRGFDLRDPGVAHGFGLTGLGERVRILNGRFHCHSSPSAGTRLDFEFPLHSPSALSATNTP